jgi:hypothetical protein
MRKLILAALTIGIMSLGSANAQISFSLNIGSQPEWGPTGYDHAEYYYMPDIDVYYDVPNHQYVYPNGRSWARSSSLPSRYSNYDLYSGYKVVVNEPQPYLRDNVYKVKYAKYKGHRGQTIIRDSRDAKYKNHYNNGRGNAYGHDNQNNGRGNDQNNGRGNDQNDGRGNGNGHDNNGRGNGHGNGHDNGHH